MALDQNSSEVLLIVGNVFTWSGKPEEAIHLYHKSIRLNPFAPGIYFAALSAAYRMAGQYEEAVTQAKKAVEREPTLLLAHVALTTSCSLAGREEEARVAAAGVLKINPNFSVEQFVMGLPYKDQTKASLAINTLRKAGLK